jgi:hypothetical protein
MRKFLLFLTVLSALLPVAGCNQRTDKDEGGVILTITDFDELTSEVSVNDAAITGIVPIGEVTMTNFPKDSDGLTSNLMDIELRSYEVVFTRADRGTRNPPTRVAGIFGNVPVGGTDTIENLRIMSLEQLTNPPLSDLLFQNGGFDKETGEDNIQVNCHLTFFGRTLSGDEIRSNTASWVIQFTP